MTFLDKAIQEYGFEDARTITIAILEDQGKTELVKDFWEILHTEEGDC